MTHRTAASVARTLAVPLSALGFRRRAGGVFTTDLTGDVIGTVALHTATEHCGPGEVEVNPIAGVRHQAVERLVADLLGEAFHPYLPATAQSAIGYLMPQRSYRAWVFTPDVDRTAANEIVAAVRDHALPFMRSLVPGEAIVAAIREHLSGNRSGYRLAAARHLMGDTPGALAALDDLEASLAAPDGPYGREVRAFAERFRARVD